MYVHGNIQSLENPVHKKIRIRDIAELADVSAGTVDRVLHNRGEVRKETKEKVLSIIEELGYTPNILAKSLASKKTYNISVIIPDANVNNPYWAKPLEGINRAVHELKDYNASVETFIFSAGNENSFKDSLERSIAGKPDGVVFCPAFKKSSAEFSGRLDQAGVPYIYIDINLEEGRPLSYFGQDASKSGYVAAKLMARTLPPDPYILIAKLANRKAISQHLVRREAGFREFFSLEEPGMNPKLISVEIDLLKPSEPGETLQKIFEENMRIDGIFVPNSRVFKVAGFLEEENKKDLFLLGYDLIDKNLEHLQKGNIDFLICQRPEEQGYKSIFTMFNFLVASRKTEKVNHSPIDIILKENYDCYLKAEKYE